MTGGVGTFVSGFAAVFFEVLSRLESEGGEIGLAVGHDTAVVDHVDKRRFAAHVHLENGAGNR